MHNDLILPTIVDILVARVMVILDHFPFEFELNQCPISQLS